MKQPLPGLRAVRTIESIGPQSQCSSGLYIVHRGWWDFLWVRLCAMCDHEMQALGKKSVSMNVNLSLLHNLH